MSAAASAKHAFQQAGKKEGGLGEGIFARLRPAKRDWGGKRPVFASAKRQSPQKLFPSRRIFCARSLKELRIFTGFVRRQAASRWAGYAPVRAQSSARKRFELRSVIATNLNIANFAGSLFARSPRLRRVSLRKKPCISELNRKVGQIQIQFFGKANGGSACEARNKQSLFPIFSVSCQRQEYKASFFNPALLAKCDLIIKE